MIVRATLILCVVILSARSEYIFRGKCTRLFQAQEIAITFNPIDVVFYRYVILPSNRTVTTQENCQSNCLATFDPPCRTAIFNPETSTCWLLRADKDTAMSFDTSGDDRSLVSGILIAPQTITDLVSDRVGGVANCNNYCPAATIQSADTITPVCIKDCATSNPVCAGELSNCMDFPRQAYVQQPNRYWNLYSSSGYAYNLMAYTFPKQFDYTNVRITVNLGSWMFQAGSTAGYVSEGWIFGWVNGRNCDGEATWHTMGREIEENYTTGGGQWAEPMHGELTCLNADFPAGNVPIRVYYEYRGYNYHFGQKSTIGLNLESQNAPIFFYVEEYIPARQNFKLDDMARCQSATVFNSQTAQWSDRSHGNYNGMTNYVIYKYKKRSDTSTLRIYWSGYVYLNVLHKCVHLHFLINDKPCTNPYPIETGIREWFYTTGTGARGPFSMTTQLDGICRGLPAGRYDIAMWVDDQCPYFGNGGNDYSFFDVGRGRPASMIIEEIHENLPINGILMADGNLVNMPNYNRQYFVFTYSGCDAVTASHSCLNPVKSVTYQKLQDASALHIKWYGSQQLCSRDSGTYYDTARFYVKIGGLECSTPTKVESWWWNNNIPYGFCSTHPKYVEGVCKMPVSAGPTTISLHVGTLNSFHYAGATTAGTSYLMVEELYDSL